MAITPKSPSTVSAPNTLTQESAASVAVPNTLTQESAASVAVPNTLTQETAASVAVPNTLTQESAASVAVPNTLTQEAAASVAVPNTLTQESAATVAVPNTLTQESAAGFPRCLTPKIAFDFADEKYSLCGEPKALSDITTYSRASSATFINRRVDGCTGDYEYFVDTDYVGSVTNLLTYSEQFDNAAWTKTRVSITANNILDPNGNRTAEKMIEDTTASSTHTIRQSLTGLVSSTDYTHSVYAKAGERKWLLVWVDGINKGCYFNLETGELGTDTSDLGSKIEHVGDGWYRCTIIVISTGTSHSPSLYLATGNETITYTGDGESGLYIWGGQFTQSAKPLPYVQTTTASASDTFSESVRIEYDAATGDSLGALIEGASTNLCLRSEEFDNASWTKTNSSVAADNVIAPDGTKSADKIIEGVTVGSVHSVSQSVTLSAATTYTASCYAKISERTEFIINNTSDANAFAYFNLVTGTLISAGTGATSSSIDNVGGGWYRCSVTFLTGAGGGKNIQIGPSVNGSNSYNGDGSSGIYIWGAQVEELPFPSSYIRTEGSSVSRSADDLKVLNASVLPKAISEQKSYHAEFRLDHLKPASASDFQTIFRTSEVNHILRVSDGGDFRASVLHGSTSGVGLTSYSLGVINTVTYTCSQSMDISIYQNKGLSNTLSGTVATGTLNAFQIGANVGGSSQNLEGHILRFDIYDKALTAKEVELL